MPEEMVIKNRLSVYPSGVTNLFRKVNEAVINAQNGELKPDRALGDCNRWIDEMERIVQGYRTDINSLILQIKNANNN